MYMRNSNYNKYAKYNIDDFPPNYSGQYTKESLREDNTDEPDEAVKSPENLHNHKKNIAGRDMDAPRSGAPHEKTAVDEPKEKKDGSFLGSLFRGNKDKNGKKGGILSGLFGRGEDKDGGILSNIELEDLILIAVIFFLLKDGFEDDLILILAIILFSS